MKSNSLEYRLANEKDLPDINKLFQEYADSLGVDLCFQNFEKELAELPGEYAPPNGCILLTTIDKKIASCVALRKIADHICEMKRLYVKPEWRGKKIGLELTERIIEEAKSKGYHYMRLDTLPMMTSAIKLYRSFGFYEIPAYRINPIEGALFMEKNLINK